MANARPIHERELLIDDEVKKQLRRTIDPRIDDALESHGYIEETRASGRLYLDGAHVLASAAFKTHYDNPFDGLSVATRHEVADGERILTHSTLELSRIGGFSTSRLVSVGNRFYTKTTRANDGQKKAPFIRLTEPQAQDILQDIRAHTELGYSSADTVVPAAEVIEELQDLHSPLLVDQRAHYQLLTSEEHGDIQMNIGRSFELKAVETKRGLQKRRINVRRIFELIATQPLEGGTSTVGVHYQSSRRIPEVKITGSIASDHYSEDEKQALYDEMVRSYQEQDIHRFGRGVLANLAKISDPESEAVRLG